MKKIALTLFSTLVLLSCNKHSGDTYHILGTIDDVPDSSMVFLKTIYGDSLVMDSTYVVDSQFEFKNKFTEPVFAELTIIENTQTPHFHGADDLGFYLEKGTIEIKGNHLIRDASISGSKLNEDRKLWKESLKPIENAITSVSSRYKDTDPSLFLTPEFRETMEIFRDSVLQAQQRIALDYIVKNNDSFLSLFDVLYVYSGEIYGFYTDPNRIDSVFQLLSPEIRNTSYGKYYKERLDKKKTVAIGAAAPDFTQYTPDGKEIKLSDYRGRYVLLDFWVSTSPPWQAELPMLMKVYETYKNKNFTIIGISFDKNKDEWKKAIANNKLPWVQVSTQTGDNEMMGNLYQVPTVPLNYLIDPDGKIVERGLRGYTLSKTLDKYIR